MTNVVSSHLESFVCWCHAPRLKCLNPESARFEEKEAFLHVRILHVFNLHHFINQISDVAFNGLVDWFRIETRPYSKNSLRVRLISKAIEEQIIRQVVSEPGPD